MKKNFLSAEVLTKALSGASGAEEISRVHTDSRSVKAGDLFFAVRGDNFDGHDFANAALDAGAFAAVVEESYRDQLQALPQERLHYVKNSLESLRQLAKLYRESLNVKIIAIGGSNGKTTTKEFTYFILQQLFGENRVFKTKKSENSILGIALSILQIRDEEIAVIEVGIDEPGWMQQHLEIVQPNLGLITTINEEHLEKLIDLETVAKEELRLLDYLREHQRGFAANLDSPHVRDQKFPAQHITYALQESAHLEGFYSPPALLHAFGVPFHNRLPGKHNAQNLLAALAICRLVTPDISTSTLRDLAASFSDFKGEAHRSLWIRFAKNVQVLDDCYNANPTSMESALQSFVEVAAGLPMLGVLGDMRELGAKSMAAHQRIINLASVMGFQQIILYGPEFMRAAETLLVLPENVCVFEDFEDVEGEVEEILRPGQAFLVKGSRGMKLERILKVFEKF